ncbi:phage portal protein [Kitasatospora sp. NPDC015120]|uniref:phage portal protein n=1 Tax=Kitasatospora sp. NPDC015120 TaxID=3364023 RepID=UPI0036F48946
MHYEPIRTVLDDVPHPHRTLAGEPLRWSAHTFRPDWKYTPEQCRILARWYELRDDAVPEDPNDPETWGRSFRWESGTLRRLKGWGKDPAMASVCAMEFVGPCRLVGFRADGSPIGGPPQEAWVQIFATAAGQNVNTMSALSTIFSQAAIDRYAIKLGQETEIMGLADVPPHYLAGSNLVNLSADALAAAETSFKRFLSTLQDSLGESWESVFRLCALVAGQGEIEQDESQVEWAEKATRSLAQAADAMVKLMQQGVPLSVALRKVPGFSQADIDEVVKAAEEAARMPRPPKPRP